MSEIDYNSTMDNNNANTKTMAIPKFNSGNKVHELYWNLIHKDGLRAWSNDNIAQIMTDAGKENLIDEVAEAFEEVLHRLLIDWKNDPNAMGTPKRLAKMYINELMAGRYTDKPVATAFPNDGPDKYEGMLVVRSELRSVCSHHHQPVVGTAYIGIIPNGKVIGLSKYTRIAQWVARRGTLQEELCNAIVKELHAATGTEDLAVYIHATHGCCENRGIMAHSSLTQTTVLKGRFNEPDVKKEFFDDIMIQQQFASK
jgi:GTP cyclohydrolase I